MSDWPNRLDRNQRVTITTGAGLNSGLGELATVFVPAKAKAAWPAANRALYAPIYVTEPVTITKLALYNGAVAGEVDCGIYSYAGSGTSLTQLASNGKVAMSGENVLQVFDITDQALLPGVYFLGAVCSTVTTATFWRYSLNNLVCQATGLSQQTLTEPVMPSTATIARPEASYGPFIMALGTRATL